MATEEAAGVAGASVQTDPLQEERLGRVREVSMSQMLVLHNWLDCCAGGRRGYLVPLLLQAGVRGGAAEGRQHRLLLAERRPAAAPRQHPVPEEDQHSIRGAVHGL